MSRQTVKVRDYKSSRSSSSSIVVVVVVVCSSILVNTPSYELCITKCKKTQRVQTI